MTSTRGRVVAVVRDVLRSIRDDHAAGREFWQQVTSRRRDWHRQASAEGDSMEEWRADDRAAWLGRLDDALTVVREAVEGDLDDAVDPHAALVDLCAVAAAWAGRMGRGE